MTTDSPATKKGNRDARQVWNESSRMCWGGCRTYCLIRETQAVACAETYLFSAHARLRRGARLAAADPIVPRRAPPGAGTPPTRRPRLASLAGSKSTASPDAFAGQGTSYLVTNPSCRGGPGAGKPTAEKGPPGSCRSTGCSAPVATSRSTRCRPPGRVPGRLLHPHPTRQPVQSPAFPS
jgi:hypothetical protein